MPYGSSSRAVLADSGTLLGTMLPPPATVAKLPGDSASCAPSPIPMRPTVPITPLAFEIVNVPARNPAYIGLKVTWAVQMVPAEFVVVPSNTQPLTPRIWNSCVPLCDPEKPKLLMVLVCSSWIRMVWEEEVDPTDVDGSLSPMPTSRIRAFPPSTI